MTFIPSYKKLSFSLLAFFAFETSHAAMADKVVASVDGMPILQSQVDSQLSQLRLRATPANKRKVINQIVDATLVESIAQREKLQIPAELFNQLLNQEVARAEQNWLAANAQQNNLNIGQFKIGLVQQGFDFNKLRQTIVSQLSPQLRQEMLFGQVQQQILVPRLQQEITKAQINQRVAELEAKAKKSSTKPILEKEYNVRHILLTTNPMLSDAQAKAKLSQIRQEILDKKITFAQAALDYSKDYYSGANGGSLGYAFAQTYVPNFARTVLNTPEGKISVPFRSKDGWHILQVTGVRNANVTKEVYMNMAFNQLMQEKLKAIGNDWGKYLRAGANVQYYQ